jgi:hypothetical protein
VHTFWHDIQSDAGKFGQYGLMPHVGMHGAPTTGSRPEKRPSPLLISSNFLTAERGMRYLAVAQELRKWRSALVDPLRGRFRRDDAGQVDQAQGPDNDSEDDERRRR